MTRTRAPRRAPGRAAFAAAALALGMAGAAAARPASIVDLQPQRQQSQVVLAGDGLRGAGLVNLNPAVNAWFLLTLTDAAATTAYHLESPDPRQAVRLDGGDGGALVLTLGGQASRCVPWAGGSASPLAQARRTALPHAPLCGGRLFLRNAVRGGRSALEAVTQLLRDHVWGGEQIVGFVRGSLYRDAFVERGAAAAASAAPAPVAGLPPAPRDANAAPAAIVPEGLGLDLGAANRSLPLGQWVPVRGLAGVHVSAMQPGAVRAGPGERTAAALPDVEARALAYLVAFDLARFDLGFSLGTDHPRLGWSARVPPAARTADGPGPDGIASAAPLVRTGMLAPWHQARAAAVFTGGFKREHGAFRYGALAQREHGSHYGFVEQGVVFSRLVPGLATLYVLDDGRIGMGTWTDADAASLMPRVRDARQNGVPLVEPDAQGVPAAGALVSQWGAGNWSGSADEQLRTLRAGACMIERDGRRHLVYGYFSSATPQAMARVFLAYGCGYAMHLDMNALEHTYLALYVADGPRRAVQHLVQGMSQLDREARGELAPRFLADPDDRDFFYLLRRQAAP